MKIILIFLCTATSTVQSVFRKQYSLRCEGGDYFFSTLVSFFSLLFFYFDRRENKPEHRNIAVCSRLCRCVCIGDGVFRYGA